MAVGKKRNGFWHYIWVFEQRVSIKATAAFILDWGLLNVGEIKIELLSSAHIL